MMIDKQLFKKWQQSADILLLNEQVNDTYIDYSDPIRVSELESQLSDFFNEVSSIPANGHLELIK